jgi:hypothetical protein
LPSPPSKEENREGNGDVPAVFSVCDRTASRQFKSFPVSPPLHSLFLLSLPLPLLPPSGAQLNQRKEIEEGESLIFTLIYALLPHSLSSLPITGRYKRIRTK